MDHIAVSSSNLRSVGYESNSSTLEIKFRSGGLYQYYNVPLSVYIGLMDASSHGKYFHRNIKGKYGYCKI
jgi:hypothetical protein